MAVDWTDPEPVEDTASATDDWTNPEPIAPAGGTSEPGVGEAPPSPPAADWTDPVAVDPAGPANRAGDFYGADAVWTPAAQQQAVDDWRDPVAEQAGGWTGPDDGSLPSSPTVGFGEGGVGARARMAPEEYERQEPRGFDRIGQAIEDTYNTGYAQFAARREDIRRSADRGDWLDVGRQVGEQIAENVPGRVARYSVDALAVTPETLYQSAGALADIGQDLANRPGPLGNRAFDAALAPAALARRLQQEGLEGVGDRLGEAWRSETARRATDRPVTTLTGIPGSVDLQVADWVPVVGGATFRAPVGDTLDFAAMMAADPTNYLGVGLGARIPGVVGKVVRGLDLAADAPFQAIARLAGNPKVGGAATMAGLGTLALDQFGQRFLDAQGKPILPSPSRWVAERVGPEYQGALSLLLPIGIGVGTAGLFRGANIGLSRASRTAIQAGGREIVKNVASGRAVLAQGYTQRADGAIVNSRTGKADPDVRLAQPGEFIDVPKRLDLPTRYSAGNLALNSYESTKAALLDQVKASPTAFGAGLRSMIDVVSQDESALRDGNRLAAAFNEGVSRTEAGRAGEIAVSPATFETVEGRQAAGLIVQTLREMAGIGPKERGNIADLIGNVMDRRGWTDDQMAVALDAMVINKVQRDLGIQNPTWASPVFRYLGLLDELSYNDAAKQALIAAGIDEAALTRGSRIAAEIANGAKGGASYRTARAEAQAQLQKIETAWKKIAPDAEGRVPRLPSALDPKLQGANINGWMDLMLASKAIFAPFQLIMRPAYTVANITSDAMAATWQTLKYGMLPSAKNIDLAKRLGLDVSHSYLTGKARGGLLGEAMFDRQPNEKLPARRGGARMFFDEIGYQMPGGRLLAKAVGLPGRLMGGAYEAATSIGPLNEVRRRQTLAATLAVAKHRQMVMDGYRSVYLGKGETPVRATELALREYNAILSGTKPEQWANGVDWNQVRTGWRTDAQAMASKLPPDQFAGAWSRYVDERIAPVIRLMEALPQERAGALIRALDPASGAKDQIAAIRDSDAIWNAMVDDVLAVYAENAPFVWPPEGSFTIVPPELQRVSPEQALVPTPPRPGSPPPDFTIVPPDQQRVSPEQALVPIPPRQGPPPPPEMQTEPQRYPIDRRIAAYRREQMRPQPGQPGQPDWMMVPPEQRRVSPEQALVPAPRQPGQEPQQPAPPPTAARPARTARPAPAQAAPTPPPAPVQPVDVRQAYARQLAQAAKAAGISREVVVARLAIDDAFYEASLKPLGLTPEQFYGRMESRFDPTGQPPPGGRTMAADTSPDFKDKVVRGWQEVSPEGRFVQTLTSKANRATVLHEGYHTYQRFMEEFPNEFAEPMRVLRETYGDNTELPARAFERYVSEGKAPTPALEAVFKQIAEWMASIYRKIVGSEIDVPLTNEVRQTFQQLLGGPAFRDDVRLRGKWGAADSQRQIWNDIGARLDAEQGRPVKEPESEPFVKRAVLDRIGRELGVDPKLVRNEIGVDAGTTLANAYRAAQAKGDMATAQRLARALNMLGLVVDQYAVLPLPYPTVPRLKAGKGGPKGSPRVDEGLPRPVAVVRMADARRLQTVMETQGMAAYVKAAQAADVWQQIYNEARQERMPAAAAVREQLTARRDQLPETASPSAAPRTGDPTPHLQDRDPRFQADAVPDPDNVQRAANVTAPAVLNVEARRLALGEAIDRLPEPLKNNTALLADAIRRAENLPPNAKGRAISDVLNEQLGRTSMRDQARGRLTPAKLFSDETAIQIVEVADRYRAYLDAVDELNRLRGDALAEAGIDTRAVRDIRDYRDVLNDIPDPYRPGWTLEDGTPYIGRGPDGEPVRTETGWQTPDGRPVRFTNGMGWVADELSPADGFRRLSEEIKAQGMDAVRGATADPDAVRFRIDRAARREIDNNAKVRSSREALDETRMRMFGYDDRSVGQNIVDHFAPYPYWTLQTIGNIAPYFARRPGQLFTLMSIFRDWAVANQNESDSDTWSVFLWRAPDGTEVRIRPLNMLFPFGQAIGEVISPFGGEDRDWARVLRSMTSVFGASPYVPIEQGAQLATTLGAGGVTDWLTGERQENRARTLTTQGQLINRIIRATTGVDFDPMKGYRQAVYGDSTLGAERYFGGLELARRARDGEISIAQARQALLDAQEGRPSPIWDSAMRAAAGEQAKIRLMTYMGVPVDVNLAQAERGRQQNLDFFGEPGRLPRPDLRLTAERDRFVQENPDMSVRWMLNDDADKLRYGAAADDIRTRYDVAQRVLDERANRGEIDGRTWQAERKKLQAAEGAEWDALAQLPKGRNLTSGPPSAPFQADDAAALEAFRKVPYDEKNPGRQGEQRSALLAEIPERIREAVLAANYADETDVERYYRTVVQPVQNAYYAIPQYRGGTPEQQERWERAYDAFNDAFQASIARNNGSTAGASAFAFAELAKQGLSRQDYEQARANRSPERSAFLKTPEGAPLAQWWGQSATSQSTTGTGTTGAAPRPAGASVPSGSQARPTGGGGGATGGAANYRTFFTTDSEYRQLQGGTPVNKLEAKLLLAESWDSLVRSGWKPEGERPDPAKVRLEIERARIFETQPRDQGAAAYNTWLADGNAKRLNTLNGQLGIATRYPEYSREQLAIVDRYLALPSGRPRSEFLTANPQAKGAIDAYFAKQGWTGSSRLVTSPTPSSQTGPSRGSGGGGGGGGSRSVTPRQSPARPAQPHDDLPAFLREAADVAATLRSGQAINSTVLAALRRRFPFGVPLSARLDDWLAVVMSRLSQQQAA